jgi:alanyl-tRNA synthetase
MKEEETKFNKTLDKGLRVFNKITKNKKTLSGKDAFLLYQSYGFPIEMTEELAREKKIKTNKKEFEEELKKHQKLSRTSSRGVFGSGLADQSEKTIKLHTATHLLNEALRKVLDKNIRQRGSNITPERLRFDFNFPRKLTEKEIRKIEGFVNKKISQGLKVTSKDMPLKKALEIGAQSEFNARYPDIVSIYSIGNFSKEICTGPHVKNTNEIGKFKIKKEESSASGIRRIKAVVG